jgi:putative thioredoxin
MLGPILERLASKANGSWVLAKLDVDHNQRLSMRYGVRGIPAVKAFVGGQVVDEFVGAQPEPMVRRFIEGLAPSREDELVKEAEGAEQAGGFEKAESIYRQVVANSPHHAQALLGLGRVLVEQSQFEEAVEILERVPLHETETRRAAEAILARITFQRTAETGDSLGVAREKLQASPNDLEARYSVANALAVQGHYEDALRHLLAIVQKDRSFRDDAARQAMLSIFNILGDESRLAQEYRSKLAMAIF